MVTLDLVKLLIEGTIAGLLSALIRDCREILNFS